MDNFFGKLIFSMGIVSSIVTQFCTVQYIQEDSDGIILWYDIVLGLFSIVFIMFGYHYLFVRSPNNNIGSHDRGMGLVVAFISILLVVLEVVLIFMVFQREKPDAAFATYLIVYAVQKIIQAALYIVIRRCNPHPEFRRGTVFYFNFLAFLNFTLWLNSIPSTKIQIYDKVSHSHFLQYVDETFKALVIDYRLLCVLLFLEHAMAIGGNNENPHKPSHHDQGFEMPERRKVFTVVGVGTGLAFLLLEIINCIQFWYGSFPDAVNILPIVVDASLVVLGYLLLRNVNSSVFHNEEVNLVLLMVSSMGATSIVYLFCFGILSFTSFKHDEPVSFVKWSACVYLVKALSLLVLLIVYTGIPVHTMESSENHNTKNYFLVSALCSGLFARFVGNILDEFKGTVHEIAHHHLQSSKLRSLRDLFVIGPLFQLAASLHLALHFLLLLCRLHEKPKIAHQVENDVQGPGDENIQPIRDNYGAVAGVAGKPNGDDVVPNGVVGPSQRAREDGSAFVSSGVRQFRGDGVEHAEAYNERSRLLQSA